MINGAEAKAKIIEDRHCRLTGTTPEAILLSVDARVGL